MHNDVDDRDGPYDETSERGRYLQPAARRPVYEDDDQGHYEEQGPYEDEGHYDEHGQYQEGPYQEEGQYQDYEDPADVYQEDEPRRSRRGSPSPHVGRLAAASCYSAAP